MEIVIKIETDEDSAVLHNDHVQVKQECSDREREPELPVELYAGHKIKEEMVIGPVVLQKPGLSAELSLQDETANLSVLEKLSQCGLCGYDIPSSMSLTQHKCTHASNTSSCDMENQRELLATKCNICNGVFHLKSLKKHLYNNKSNNISCETCREQITGTNLFTVRKNNHGRPEPFQCRFCDKKFAFKSFLINHERIHTGDKPFTCSICNKRFAGNSSLTAHRRIHSGDKPYSCKICNKKFSDKSSFNRHARIHSGDKPYFCKICNMQFSQSWHLTRHRRIHSGEKPYSCEVCNKRFSQSSYLNTHRRIHSGEKPYSCKVCNKKFSDRSTSIKHERFHSRNST